MIGIIASALAGDEGEEHQHRVDPGADREQADVEREEVEQLVAQCGRHRLLPRLGQRGAHEVARFDQLLRQRRVGDRPPQHAVHEPVEEVPDATDDAVGDEQDRRAGEQEDAERRHRGARPAAARTAPRGPNSMAGSASTGRTNSVAVDRIPTAVSAVLVVAPSNPARVNIWYIVAPPVAAPPGSARLSALPVSCAHAMSNQSSVCNAMRMSTQMHTNAAASSTKIGTNQAGNTASSWGSEPNMAIKPGNTR